MATRRKKASGRRRSNTATARGRKAATSRSSRQDAIALLKADHRQVEGWFEQFEKTRSDERKRDLAGRICAALKAHTTIEEEIFYPAYLAATGDQEMHHEAEVEHEGAKRLIAEIEGSGPEDEYYDARVSVLSEMIKHHVNEEEQRDGMFNRARQSDMDLQAIGEQLQARKMELMGEGGSTRDRGFMASLERLSSRNGEGARR